MIRKTFVMSIVLLVAAILAGGAWAAEADKPLDNAEIVK